MKALNQLLVYAILVSVVSCSVGGKSSVQPVNPQSPNVIVNSSDKLFCQLESKIVDKYIAQHIYQGYGYPIDASTVVGASIAVVQNGQICYFNYGKSSLNYDALNTSNETLYEIGSITKTFTATMLAKNVVGGRLGLDLPIQQEIKNLPDTINMPSDYSSLSYLMYANMTTGFPSYPLHLKNSDLKYPQSQAAFDYLHFKNFLESETADPNRFNYPSDKEGSFNFLPIGTYNYSDMSYGVLGVILMNIDSATKSMNEFNSPDKFNSMITNNIGNPLNMSCITAAAPQSISNPCNYDIASGYSSNDYTNSGISPVAPYPWSIGFGPGGNLRSNTKSIVNYIQALLGYNQIRDENSNVLTSVDSSLHKALQVTINRDKQFYYQPAVEPKETVKSLMAWDIFESSNSNMYYKYGETAGFDSTLVLNMDNQFSNPGNDFGIIVFVNTDNSKEAVPSSVALDITKDTPKLFKFAIKFVTNNQDSLNVDYESNVIWTIKNNYTQYVAVPIGNIIELKSQVEQCSISVGDEGIHSTTCANKFGIVLPLKSNNYLMTVTENN